MGQTSKASLPTNERASEGERTTQATNQPTNEPACRRGLIANKSCLPFRLRACLLACRFPPSCSFSAPLRSGAGSRAAPAPAVAVAAALSRCLHFLARAIQIPRNGPLGSDWISKLSGLVATHLASYPVIRSPRRAAPGPGNHPARWTRRLLLESLLKGNPCLVKRIKSFPGTPRNCETAGLVEFTSL